MEKIDCMNGIKKYYLVLMSLALVSNLGFASTSNCTQYSTSAIYIASTGLVCLQQVKVIDQSSIQFYGASLQWLGSDNPSQFSLIHAELDTTPEQLGSPSFSAENGALVIPKVDIPRQFGTERYSVNLTLTPDSSAYLFNLDSISIYINPDYVPRSTWKPYGMLNSTERRAVDALGISLPYARLSDAIYDFDNTPVDQWDLIDKISRDSGMQAGVYQHRETFELVLAYRGTEACDFPCSLNETKEYLRDLATDTALTFGFDDAQFKHAINYGRDIVNRYPNRNITVTGHSLGGGLAQAVGAVLGLKTFAFNSAPVPDDFFDDNPVSLPESVLNDLIYVLGDIHDPVSNTDETGKFYINSKHAAPLIQFDFDLKEITPNRLAELDELRFNRHGITKFFDNASNLMTIYASGW